MSKSEEGQLPSYQALEEVAIPLSASELKQEINIYCHIEKEERSNLSSSARFAALPNGEDFGASPSKQAPGCQPCFCSRTQSPPSRKAFLSEQKSKEAKESGILDSWLAIFSIFWKQQCRPGACRHDATGNEAGTKVPCPTMVEVC